MTRRMRMATALAGALATAALGAGAVAAAEPLEFQSVDPTAERVMTQNSAEESALKIQERNRVHQADLPLADLPQAERARAHNQEECADPDGAQAMNRRADHGEGEMGQGAGVLDGTGPLHEGPKDGTGQQYGRN